MKDKTVNAILEISKVLQQFKLDEVFKTNDMITEENIGEFKKLYKNALGELEESFMFKGRKVLTAYAKCLIEWWDNIYD